MMKIEDEPRQPIYGNTVTAGFNGLLDKAIKLEKADKLAVRALRKLAFVHPELNREITSIIGILEK